MVFDPTFNEIKDRSDQLPDVKADVPDIPGPEGDTEQLEAGGILEETTDAEGLQDGAVSSEAAAAIVSGDVDESDLPAYGA